MSLNLTKMRALLRRGLGDVDEQDIDTETIDDYLNLSLWEIEDKFPFETRKTTATLAFVEGQHEYSLSEIPLLDALRSISWVDQYGLSHKLDRITRDTLDEIFNDASGTDPTGEPTQFLREGESLFVWPPPGSSEDSQTIQLAIWQGVESLTIGADTTGLPRNWSELVVYGAISRGHFFEQEYAQARESRNFQAGITASTVSTETKEEEDSRYAGLEVARGRPATRASYRNPRIAP